MGLMMAQGIIFWKDIYYLIFLFSSNSTNNKTPQSTRNRHPSISNQADVFPIAGLKALPHPKKYSFITLLLS